MFKLDRFSWSQKIWLKWDPPVLGYPDFSKGFILKMDTSLKGLGTVLSELGEDGKSTCHSIASRTLCPPDRSMQNYSSTDLKAIGIEVDHHSNFCN